MTTTKEIKASLIFYIFVILVLFICGCGLISNLSLMKVDSMESGLQIDSSNNISGSSSIYSNVEKMYVKVVLSSNPVDHLFMGVFINDELYQDFTFESKEYIGTLQATQETYLSEGEYYIKVSGYSPTGEALQNGELTFTIN